MNKITPQQSPEFCLAITEASYEQGIEKGNILLKKQFPDAEVLDEATFRGWRMILIKHEDQLSVAFRGTAVWHNWAGNLYHELLGDWAPTTRHMERKIDEWENRLGLKVSLLAAHSGSATWCNAVRKTEDIARIVLDPHKASDRKKTINLVTSGDPLSIACLLFSKNIFTEIQKYTVVGDGGHSLEDFRKHLIGKSWEQILPATRDPSSLSEVEGHLLNKAETAFLRKGLEENQQVLLQKTLKCAEVKKIISNSSSFIASKIHQLITQRNQDKERTAHYHQIRERIVQKGEACSQEILNPSRVSSSGIFAEILSSRFDPNQAIDLISQITQLTFEYDQQIEKLGEEWNSTQKVDQLLKTQLHQINQLDHRQQKEYTKLVGKQREIAKKVRKLEIISSSLKVISDIYPLINKTDLGVHPLIDEMNSGINKILFYKYNIKLQKGEKEIRKLTNSLQKNLHIKEQLASTSQKNQILQDRSLLQLINALNEREKTANILPSKHRTDLEQSIPVLNERITTIDGSIQEWKQTTQQNDQKIAYKKNKIDAINGKLEKIKHSKKNKKSEKKDLQRKKQKLEKELVLLEAENTNYRVEVDAATQNKNTFKTQLDETQKDLDNAQKYGAYRDQIWSVIQSEGEWVKRTTEEAVQLKKELDDAFKHYIDARAPRQQMMSMLAQKATLAFQAFGFQREGEVVQVAATAYQLVDQFVYFNSYVKPSFQLMIEKSEGSFFQIMNSNKDVVISKFVIPALSSIVMGGQLLKSLYDLWSDAGNKKPMYQYMTEELQKDIQSLGQELTTLINHKTDILQNTLLGEFEKVKSLLAQSTKYLGDAIKDVNENVSISTSKTNVRVFDSKISGLEQTFRQEYNATFFKFFEKKKITINQLQEKIKLFESDNNVIETQRIHADPIEHVRYNFIRESHVLLITDIIAYHLGDQGNFPNGKLLSILSGKFIEMVEQISKSTSIIHLLKETPSLKTLLSNLGSKFLNSFEQMASLCQAIEPLIYELHQIQEGLCTGIKPKLVDAPRHITAGGFANVIDSFGWGEFKKELIAERKFALYNELFPQFSNRMKQLRSLLNKDDLARCPKINHFLHKTLKIISLGFYKESIEEFVDYDREKHWHQKLTPMQTAHDLFAKIIGTSENPPTLEKSKEYDSWSPKKDYSLGFDLKKREIQWYSANESTNNQLILKTSLILNAWKLFLYESSPTSFFTPQNLKNIEDTKGSKIDNYKDVLKNLIDRYHSTLNKLDKKEIISETDPFYPLKDGQIVLCAEQNGIPLILPKKLIDHLESVLIPTMGPFRFLLKGTLVPRYQFCTQKRELSIQFDWKQEIDSKKFAKFKVATFDEYTIQSFKTDLSESVSKFNPNEFLIQAMYGSFATQKLGLPDKQTVFFPTLKTIAPSERDFIGLYKLLEIYPDRLIVYNSQEIDSQTTETHFATTTLTTPEFLEGYVKVAMDIQEKKDNSTKKYQSNLKVYQSKYHLLVLLIALHFDINYKKIIGMLESDLELFSPEKEDLLHRLSSVGQISRFTVSKFLDGLENCPSEFMWEMIRLHKNIYNINEWIENDFTGLEINRPNKKNNHLDQKLNQLLKNFAPILDLQSSSNSQNLLNLFQETQEGVEETKGNDR